ncbi:hypothetical protein NKR19_g8088 [Coniochaeta hoffmannii]|uniref:Metalloendopeptidase n=1 Tax=Coniochaeta hoffmannii TaxID=91930 RepID=A0AA38VF76_9PEZI|nr:hypothetical protein NKR19_g8088 [Coniochaeta hoffmannii]
MENDSAAMVPVEEPFCSAYEYMAAALHVPNIPAQPSDGQLLPSIPPLHFDTPVFWKTGQVLRMGFYHATNFQKAEVTTHAVEWCRWADLEFRFVTKAPYNIHIAFQPGSSWSLLGTQALSRTHKSPPRPSMNLGWVNPQTPAWVYRATILHEFCHALGLVHEHQNARRDFGREWDIPAMYDHLARPPNQWGLDRVNRNVLSICTGKLLRKNFIDEESIKLYAFPGKLFKGHGGYSKNYELSAIDKGSMLMRYPGREPGEYT